MVILKLDNTSTTEDLGAYFTETIDTTTPITTRALNVYKPMVQGSELEFVNNTTAQAILSDYTKLPKNGSAYVTIEILLKALPLEKLVINLEISFKIDAYNMDLVPSVIIGTDSESITSDMVSEKVNGDKTSLIKVKIADGVKKIGVSAFSGCSSLKSINLEE